VPGRRHGLGSAAAGLALALAVLVPYIILPELRPCSPGAPAGRAALGRWLAVAVSQEEQELNEAHPPIVGRRRDVVVAGIALLLVVVASVAMERTRRPSVTLRRGRDCHRRVVLAAVTSLPNAVAAVYLAMRGRGAAMLSTTLNSNALNVTPGCCCRPRSPAWGRRRRTAPSSPSELGLTAAALSFAYRTAACAASQVPSSLVPTSYFSGRCWPRRIGRAIGRSDGRAGLIVAAACAAGLLRRPRRRLRRERGSARRPQNHLGQQHVVGIQVHLAGGADGRSERDRMPQRVRP